MKVHTIQEIQIFPADAPLEAVEGAITSIYPRKNGISAAGKAWSFQDAVLRDGAGNDIKLKLVGCEAMDPLMKNKHVRLCSHVGDRGRTGMYALDDEYNGVTTRKIKLTPSHSIIDLATSTTGAGLSQAVNQNLAQNAPQQQHQAPPPANHPPAHNPPATAQSHAAVDDVTSRAYKLMAKITGLQAKCYDAAVHNAHGIFERHGIAIMPGAVGVMGDKIFMETIRRIDIDLLPMDPYRHHPFRGKPLDTLIPHMRQQIAEGKAEIDYGATEARHALGRKSIEEAAATPPPVIEEPLDETMPF